MPTSTHTHTQTHTVAYLQTHKYAPVTGTAAAEVWGHPVLGARGRTGPPTRLQGGLVKPQHAVAVGEGRVAFM